MKTKYRFIHFEEARTLYGNGWEVKNNRTNAVLGEITYYPEWDDYVFQASPKSIFNSECLKDIIDFISHLE
jgi:hypothetical protein